jgi:mRNA interferase MazF
MVTYKQFDVVVVPFPFTDKSTTKKRPAVVISDANTFNLSLQKSVMAMITTTGHSSWNLDIPITDLSSAGLKASSLIRMKLFTLDNILVIKKIGTLTLTDQLAVRQALKQLFRL